MQRHINYIGKLFKNHEKMSLINKFISNWKKLMFSAKYRKFWREYTQEQNLNVPQMPTSTEIRWLKWYESANWLISNFELSINFI